MTPTQTRQFNQMRAALIRIAREYMTPQRLRATCHERGLAEDEALEYSYENIQTAAANAVHGVREIKETAK